MRDKSLCWRCKYHTYMGTLSADKMKGPFEELTDSEIENIACYYSVRSGVGCAIKPDGPRSTYDTRGEGPGCNLFAEGKCDIKEHKHSFSTDLGKFAR